MSKAALRVEYGTKSVTLLDANDASSINAQPGDRFLWTFLPEYEAGTADRAEPVQETDGVRSLTFVYPRAVASGVYALQQVPSSDYDTRDLSSRQNLFLQRLRILHPFESHIIERGQSVVVQESGVTHWVRWTLMAPSSLYWADLYKSLRTESERLMQTLRLQGLQAASDALGESLTLRLLGMRYDATRKHWTYRQLEYDRVLGVDGPPTDAGYQTMPQQFVDFAALFDTLQPSYRERMRLLMWLDPWLVQEYETRGATHWPLDAAGLWLAERRVDDSVELLAAHEVLQLDHHVSIVPYVPPRRPQLSGATPTLRGTDTSQFMLKLLHVDLPVGEDATPDKDAITLMTDLGLSGVCRWYVYPIPLGDEPANSEQLVATFRQAHQTGWLVGVGREIRLQTADLLNAAFVRDKAQDLLAGMRVALGFVCYDELDKLDDEIAPLASLSGDQKCSVPRRSDKEQLSLQEALDRVRMGVYYTRLPDAQQAPIQPACFSMLSWRAPLGAVLLLIERSVDSVPEPRPPPPQPKVILKPYVIEQYRRLAAQQILEGNGCAGVHIPGQGVLSSPRLDTLTFASMIERVTRSRCHVYMAFNHLATRDQLSIAAVLERVAEANMDELYTVYGFSPVLGCSDTLWMQPYGRGGPEPASRALFIAANRLERVQMWSPDGFSDECIRWFRHVLSLESSKGNDVLRWMLESTLDRLNDDEFNWLVDLKQRDQQRLESERHARSLDYWLREHRFDPTQPLFPQLSRDLPDQEQILKHIRSKVQAYARLSAMVAAHKARRSPPGQEHATVLQQFTQSDFTAGRLLQQAKTLQIEDWSIDQVYSFDRLPIELFPEHMTEYDLCMPLPVGRRQPYEFCLHYVRNQPFVPAAQSFYGTDKNPFDASLPGEDNVQEGQIRMAWLTYRARTDPVAKESLRQLLVAFAQQYEPPLDVRSDGDMLRVIWTHNRPNPPDRFSEALQSVQQGYQPIEAVENKIWRTRIQSLQDAYALCQQPGRVESIYKQLAGTLSTVYSTEQPALYEQWAMVQTERTRRWFVEAQMMIDIELLAADTSRLLEPPSLALFYRYLDSAPISVQLANSLRQFQSKAEEIERDHRPTIVGMCRPRGPETPVTDELAQKMLRALIIGREQQRTLNKANRTVQADGQLQAFSQLIDEQHVQVRGAAQEYIKQYGVMLQNFFTLDLQRFDFDESYNKLKRARSQLQSVVVRAIGLLTTLVYETEKRFNQLIRTTTVSGVASELIGVEQQSSAIANKDITDARNQVIELLRRKNIDADSSWDEQALVLQLGVLDKAPQSQVEFLAAIAQWLVEFPDGGMWDNVKLQDPHNAARNLLDMLADEDTEPTEKWKEAYDAWFAAFGSSVPAGPSYTILQQILLNARSYQINPVDQLKDRRTQTYIAMYEAGRELPSLRATVIANLRADVLLEQIPDQKVLLTKAGSDVLPFLRNRKLPTDLTGWLHLLRGKEPLENLARLFWRDVLVPYMMPYENVFSKLITVLSKETPAVVLFPEQLNALQTQFFRPDSREATLLTPAFNTCFLADPDNGRDETALPRVAWQERLRVLQRQAAQEREVPSTGVWTAAESMELLLRRKTPADLARAALRVGVREFYRVGPPTRSAVPSRLFELLLWALIESPSFLTMRQRYSLDAVSDVAPLFTAMIPAWRVTEPDEFVVVDELATRELLDLVETELPGALKPLEKLAAQSRYQHGVDDMWRLSLFGYGVAPSVVIRLGQPIGKRANPARQRSTALPLDTLAAAQLSRFIVAFDGEITAAIGKLADKTDQETLRAVDGLSLLHSCFVFALAYLAPAHNPREALFLQQRHPDGRILHDYVHGRAVIELARRVYDVQLHTQPVDSQWRSVWNRVVHTGLLYDPDYLTKTPAELETEFKETVLQPALAATNRVLLRYERARLPFALDTDLAYGRGMCFIKNKGNWYNASPLTNIDTRSAPGHPEGVDIAYNDEHADFELEERWSYFEWRVGQQCYLRPAKAQLNAWPHDAPAADAAESGLLPTEYWLRQTPLLAWFDRVRAQTFDRRPDRNFFEQWQAKNFAYVDLRPESMSVDEPQRLEQKRIQYDALQARLDVLRGMRDNAPWNNPLFVRSQTQLDDDITALRLAVVDEERQPQHEESTYVGLLRRVQLLEQGVTAHQRYLNDVLAYLDRRVPAA